MPWAMFDDGIATHPKFVDRAPAAKLVFMLSIVYCNRELTDGELSPSARLIIFAQAGEDVLTCAKSITSELIAAGLWDERGGAIHVHDYLQWNRSRAQVLAERQHRQEAGRAGGVKSAEVRREKYGTAQPEAPALGAAQATPEANAEAPASILLPKQNRTQSDSDSDSDSESESTPRTSKSLAPSAPRDRFIPPSLDEVRAYMTEKGHPECAEPFFNHYEANGWHVGRTKMQKWHNAVANWIGNLNEYGNKRNGKPPSDVTMSDLKAKNLRYIQEAGLL